MNVSSISKSNKILTYDTVVVGGGLAGISAAIASARLGCRTALIHNRPVIGGNSSVDCKKKGSDVW